MNQTKQRVWEELAARPGRLPALSSRRLKLLQKKLENDPEFWADLLERHGLDRKKLCDLETAIQDHATGNFWGMLAQAAHEAGFKI